jgi:hypothetical protein
MTPKWFLIYRLQVQLAQFSAVKYRFTENSNFVILLHLNATRAFLPDHHSSAAHSCTRAHDTPDKETTVRQTSLVCTLEHKHPDEWQRLSNKSTVCLAVIATVAGFFNRP